MFRSKQVFFNHIEEMNYEKIYKKMKNSKSHLNKKNLLRLITNRGGLESPLALYVNFNSIFILKAMRIIVSWPA